MVCMANANTYIFISVNMFMPSPSGLFKALSDPTRLSIAELLLGGEKCVCEIFPKVKRAQPTVSLQLAKLESLGIVKSRREGKSIYYSISNPKVKRVLDAAGHDTQVAEAKA